MRHFIFQVNPSKCDVAKLRLLKDTDWRCDKMASSAPYPAYGDIGLIWQSGPNRGVIGMSIITSDAQVRPTKHPHVWLPGKEDKGAEHVHRVDMHVTWLKETLMLEGNEDFLGHLLIARCAAAGSCFPIEADDYTNILRLIGATAGEEKETRDAPQEDPLDRLRMVLEAAKNSINGMIDGMLRATEEIQELRKAAALLRGKRDDLASQIDEQVSEEINKLSQTVEEELEDGEDEEAPVEPQGDPMGLSDLTEADLYNLRILLAAHAIKNGASHSEAKESIIDLFESNPNTSSYLSYAKAYLIPGKSEKCIKKGHDRFGYYERTYTVQEMAAMVRQLTATGAAK